MKITISHKLILAFLGLTLLVLIATLTLARWSFERGFLDYVNAVAQTELEWIKDDLAQEYRSGQNSWNEITDDRFNELLRQALRARFKHRGRPPHHFGERPPPPKHHADRPPRRRFKPGPPIALFDAKGQQIAGSQLSGTEENHIRVPIVADDKEVGELRIEPRRRLNTPQETAFSRQQLYASWIIGAISLCVALIVSLLMARGFLAPIRRMINNVAELSRGDYSARLHEKRSDELGQLMNDLDRLGTKLEESRSSRQRWLADISHELRTPLTVLTGELEALKDGIRKFDQNELDSLDQEVKRLRHLVDDLYELSVSDIGGLKYTLTKMNLKDCLGMTVESLRERVTDQQIELILNSTDAEVNADAQRLNQLFQNLLINSLDYTDTPGHIEVMLTRNSSHAVIEFHDSPPGVSADECEQLFEPLFRKEESRSRRTGGAGLGLAICRNIVEAHGGIISASPSHLGGLCVHIEIPLADGE